MKMDFRVLFALLSQLPNIVLVAAVIAGGIFAYTEFKAFTAGFRVDLNGLKDARFNEQQRRLDELNRSFLRLGEDIARAKTDILSADELEKIFRETIDSRIQSIAAKNDEQVVAIANAIALLQSNLETNVESQGRTITTPDGQDIEIHDTDVYARDHEGQRGIKVAKVVFDKTNNEWDKYSERLDFEVTSVITEQVSGANNHYIQVGLRNRADPFYRDRVYPLGIDTFHVAQREKSPAKWHFPRMHVEGGLGSSLTTGNATLAYEIGLSLMAYGPSAHDNTVRLFRVGLGVNENADDVFGSLSPIGLNIRSLGVPFVSDTWAFAGVSLRRKGKLGLSAALQTTF
ncbi:MAG: hypothetical protein HN404_15750 [Gemmatimonadetes bacterium]|jgi:hypothetical protein|nr:hypothetical protein [Gemmatimonadota bacterium]